MSKRRHSAMIASKLEVDEQSGSNVAIINDSVSTHKLAVRLAADVDLRMLYVDDDGCGAIEIESETDDDEWVSDGHASDEELEDNAAEYNVPIADIKIEPGTDVDQHPVDDDGPLAANYMTQHLDELPLSQKFKDDPIIKGMNTRANIFNLIFTQPMKTIIICHTNRKGHALAALWNKKKPYRNNRQWQDIDDIEFDAFLAILLVMGVHKSNYDRLSELWTRQANCIYRASMSRVRFKAILKTIRFDEANTREARMAIDKAAPITELWLMMNDNLKKNYKPHLHASITIAEQLFPFRGPVSFKQYLPSKPAKYGLQVFWATDERTHYPLGGIIYMMGWQSGAKRARYMDEDVVIQLVKPYENDMKYEIDTASDGKQQVILDSDSTKDGVNTIEKMLAAYTCKRRTNRWPLAMFFNMVDVMTMAAYLIWMETLVDTTPRQTRRTFITKLASELAKAHISRRSLDPLVTRIPGVRSAIEDMLDSKLCVAWPKFDPALAEKDSSGRIKTQGKCYICPRKRNTRKRCMTCNKPVCDEHTQRIVKCLCCH